VIFHTNHKILNQKMRFNVGCFAAQGAIEVCLWCSFDQEAFAGKRDAMEDMATIYVHKDRPLTTTGGGYEHQRHTQRVIDEMTGF
jgi:hypothetical protein